MTYLEILGVMLASFIGTLLALCLVEEIKAHHGLPKLEQPEPPDDEEPAELPAPEPEPKPSPAAYLALADEIWLEELMGRAF